MKEKSDYLGEEETGALNRYIGMLNSKIKRYFDVFEFEYIIDHYIDHQEFKLAADVIEYALKIHPHALIILQKKAQVLINKGYHYQAIKILKEILKIESSNSTVAFLLGIAYCSLGEISKSLVNFDKAISIATDEKEDFLINAGTTLEQIGQYELAIRYFEQALDENEYNTIALYEMAYCCEKLNYDKESIKFYRLYLAEDPYSRLAWTNLSGVYYKFESYDESIEAIEFAIAIDPEYSFSYFQKGLSEIFNMMYAEGIESLKHFVSAEPNDAEAFFYLGEAYARLDNNTEAIKYFDKAIVLDNTHSDAYYGLAYIYFEEKKYTNAFYTIKKALKIDPGQSDFWHLSALIYQKLGFIEDSESAFKTGIELEHSDPQIWIDYSELETGKKSISRKINILSEAFEHFSDNAEINYRLAANLALIQNVETAVYHLNKALIAEPSKLEIFRSIYSDRNIVLEKIIDQYFYNNNSGGNE